MSMTEQFEAHIKSAAWYRVLSEAAKDDGEAASVFRMARMAASEAWNAALASSDAQADGDKGEAVATLTRTGRIAEWELLPGAFSLSGGKHTLYTAPQAECAPRAELSDNIFIELIRKFPTIYHEVPYAEVDAFARALLAASEL